jgi:hypothetical protein
LRDEVRVDVCCINCHWNAIMLVHPVWSYGREHGRESGKQPDASRQPGVV